MIFPTEALLALRMTLGHRVKTGDLTPLEMFRVALQADPDDYVSLSNIFGLAFAERQWAEAERLGWEMVRTRPTSPNAYLMLGTVYQERGGKERLASEVIILGLEMMLLDEEELQAFDLDKFMADETFSALVRGLANPDAVRVALNTRKTFHKSGPVSPKVSRCYHILALRAAGPAPVDSAVVDPILADPRGYAPLLRGILKEYAEGGLSSEVALVERALVLLGEIGDPAIIPDLTGFYLEDALSEPAQWAFWRIASRRPDEAFEQIRRSIPLAEGRERFVATQQIVNLPDLPGRVEALTQLLDGMEDLPRDQRSGIFAGAVGGIFVIDGADSPTGVALMSLHDKMLNKKLRKQIARIRELRRNDGPADPTSFGTTVYDICCTGPNLTVADDLDVPF